MGQLPLRPAITSSPVTAYFFPRTDRPTPCPRRTQRQLPSQPTTVRVMAPSSRASGTQHLARHGLRGCAVQVLARRDVTRDFCDKLDTALESP